MAPLLVNPPCEVHFDGWRTTTRELGAYGWKISLEEDFYRQRSVMLLWHRGSDIKMRAESDQPLRHVDPRYVSQREWESRYPVFKVVQAFTNMTIRSHGSLEFEAWNDTRPAMLMVEERDIMSYPLFLKESAPAAEELIVEPQDVMSLLDQIKRMQAPGQADIRKKQRAETVPLVHASILTFPNAA